MTEMPAAKTSGRTFRKSVAREYLESVVVAIILALFSDSPEPHLGAPEVQQAMFDGPSQYGTVSEYYQEVSGGRFSVTGQAFPWIRTHITRAEVVGTEYGLGDDDRTGEYLLEAVAVVELTNHRLHHVLDSQGRGDLAAWQSAAAVSDDEDAAALLDGDHRGRVFVGVVEARSLGGEHADHTDSDSVHLGPGPFGASDYFGFGERAQLHRMDSR